MWSALELMRFFWARVEGDEKLVGDKEGKICNNDCSGICVIVQRRAMFACLCREEWEYELHKAILGMGFTGSYPGFLHLVSNLNLGLSDSRSGYVLPIPGWLSDPQWRKSLFAHLAREYAGKR